MKIIPSNFDENVCSKSLKPEEFVLATAQGKSSEVS